jgi:hypothetical protein
VALMRYGSRGAAVMVALRSRRVAWSEIGLPVVAFFESQRLPIVRLKSYVY